MSKTTEDKTASAPPPAKKDFSGLHVFGIVLLTIVATVGAGYWWLSHYVFPENFDPVTLNASEQGSLNNKLNSLGIDTQGGESGRPLQPESYSEEGARREVHFSEQELNGMLANNTDLAQRLAVDLSDDLLSALLLVPLEEGFPLLGGRTLRVNAGVELSFANGRPWSS